MGKVLHFMLTLPGWDLVFIDFEYSLTDYNY